ncbi:MAG: PilN domain-containing protein [Armatimonadota bacterium]|nr:PilN domain-containing protein [Armatimonadota bacterium]
MPSINMIASRRSEKHRFERNMRRLMVVILAEVALGVLLGALFTIRICSTNQRISDLDVQLQKLQPTVRKIEDYEAATTMLKPRLQLLTDAQDKTTRWRKMLAELSHALPQRTWLTKLATNVPQPGQTGGGVITVSLNGVAADQNQVGEAMLRLNTYPDFERIDLHFTQGSAVGKTKAVEFEIAASLKQDDKAKEGVTNAGAKS